MIRLINIISEINLITNYFPGYSNSNILIMNVTWLAVAKSVGYP